MDSKEARENGGERPRDDQQAGAQKGKGDGGQTGCDDGEGNERGMEGSGKGRGGGREGGVEREEGTLTLMCREGTCLGYASGTAGGTAAVGAEDAAGRRNSVSLDGAGPRNAYDVRRPRGCPGGGRRGMTEGTMLGVSVLHTGCGQKTLRVLDTGTPFWRAQQAREK